MCMRSSDILRKRPSLAHACVSLLVFFARLTLSDSELLGHPSAACRRQFPLLPGAAKRSGDSRNLSAANSVKDRWAAGVSRSQPPVPGLRVPTPSFRERCFPARCGCADCRTLLLDDTISRRYCGKRRATVSPVPSRASASNLNVEHGDFLTRSTSCASPSRTPVLSYLSPLKAPSCPELDRHSCVSPAERPFCLGGKCGSSIAPPEDACASASRSSSASSSPFKSRFAIPGDSESEAEVPALPEEVESVDQPRSIGETLFRQTLPPLPPSCRQPPSSAFKLEENICPVCRVGCRDTYHACSANGARRRASPLSGGGSTPRLRLSRSSSLHALLRDEADDDTAGLTHGQRGCICAVHIKSESGQSVCRGRNTRGRSAATETSDSSGDSASSPSSCSSCGSDSSSNTHRSLSRLSASPTRPARSPCVQTSFTKCRDTASPSPPRQASACASRLPCGLSPCRWSASCFPPEPLSCPDGSCRPVAYPRSESSLCSAQRPSAPSSSTSVPPHRPKALRPRGKTVSAAAAFAASTKEKKTGTSSSAARAGSFRAPAIRRSPDALARRAAAAEFAAIHRRQASVRRQSPSTRIASRKTKSKTIRSSPTHGLSAQEQVEKRSRNARATPKKKHEDRACTSPTAAAATALACALAAAAVPVERALATSALFASPKKETWKVDTPSQEPNGLERRQPKRGGKPQSSAAFQRLTRSSAPDKKKRTFSTGASATTATWSVRGAWHSSSSSGVSVTTPLGETDKVWALGGTTVGAKETLPKPRDVPENAARTAAAAAVLAAAAALMGSSTGASCQAVCTAERLAEEARAWVASLEATPFPRLRSGEHTFTGSSRAPSLSEATLETARAAVKSAEAALLRLQKDCCASASLESKQSEGTSEKRLGTRSVTRGTRTAAESTVSRQLKEALLSEKITHSRQLGRPHTSSAGERQSAKESRCWNEQESDKVESLIEEHASEKQGSSTAVSSGKQRPRGATAAARAGPQAAIPAVETAVYVQAKRGRKADARECLKTPESTSEESEGDSIVSLQSPSKKEARANREATEGKRAESKEKRREKETTSSSSTPTSGQGASERDSDAERGSSVCSAHVSDTTEKPMPEHMDEMASRRDGAVRTGKAKGKRDKATHDERGSSDVSGQGVFSLSAAVPLSLPQDEQPPSLVASVGKSSTPLFPLTTAAAGAHTSKEEGDGDTERGGHLANETGDNGDYNALHESLGDEAYGTNKGMKESTREAKSSRNTQVEERKDDFKWEKPDATHAADETGEGKASSVSSTPACGDTIKDEKPGSSKPKKKKKKEKREGKAPKTEDVEQKAAAGETSVSKLPENNDAEACFSPPGSAEGVPARLQSTEESKGGDRSQENERSTLQLGETPEASGAPDPGLRRSLSGVQTLVEPSEQKPVPRKLSNGPARPAAMEKAAAGLSSAAENMAKTAALLRQHAEEDAEDFATEGRPRRRKKKEKATNSEGREADRRGTEQGRHAIGEREAKKGEGKSREKEKKDCSSVDENEKTAEASRGSPAAGHKAAKGEREEGEEAETKKKHGKKKEGEEKEALHEDASGMGAMKSEEGSKRRKAREDAEAAAAAKFLLPAEESETRQATENKQQAQRPDASEASRNGEAEAKDKRKKSKKEKDGRNAKQDSEAENSHGGRRERPKSERKKEKEREPE
ncbi:hypothetical protein TGP89_259150 [Toxoplasma gondii p89]|uniref:Transmembrane protein n=1 Tax=Toxoplasma gondii p89 TaxID=943119 RepID=A0A086K7M2_TOXGO|nr:hypothetical protein TGP89_259150 [Toxoplasma gondii p89]